MSAQLSIQEVSKASGGVQAAAQVDLDIRQGELLSVIGPNGAEDRQHVRAEIVRPIHRMICGENLSLRRIY